MGNYFNPGNSGFSRIRNDDYVDKTGLIARINQTMDTPQMSDLYQQTPSLRKILCGSDAVRVL